MQNTIILKNEEKVSINDFVNLFTKTLETSDDFEKSEIEELTEIMAKNPVDKFIISTKPTVPVMQGDLLIWSDSTKEYKENYPLVENIQRTTQKVLQEDDSITGDHELVPLSTADYKVFTGEFVPPIIKSAAWGNNEYKCKLLEIDSPFVIKHREHGNITLTAGKYMICSSLDSSTLSRMRD